LEYGKKSKLNIKIIPEKMVKHKDYSGVFLMRLPNGFSRPVTIIAKRGLKPIIKPKSKHGDVIYFEAEKGIVKESFPVIQDELASNKKCILVEGKGVEQHYQFEIPKTGKYYILLRARSAAPIGKHNSIFYGIDNLSMKASHLSSNSEWKWCLAAQNSSSWSGTLQAFELKKGLHKLRISARESIFIDSIGITDTPGIFRNK
jgi:hypothetical protein